MTAADRPSVTYDARAVREAAMNLYRAMRRTNPDAWAEVDEVEDWAYWDDIVRTAQVTLAAGRAETTPDEECGDYPAPCNCDDPETHDGAATVTVLYVPGEQPGPSTDQALAEAWAEGHRTGWEHCQDGNYGNDHWDDPTPNPYAAADRPSVTDNARDEAERRWPRLYGPEETLTYPREAVREHTRGGFVAGAEWAAGRAETTTATDEDMFEQAWEVIVRVRDAHPRTVDDAPTEDIVDALIDAGLLATARTRPTREQIARALDRAGAFCGECGAEPGDFFDSCLECQRWLLNYADAVLALYADQPTEAEAGARALEQAAEWLRSDMDEPWGDRAANRLDVRAARIRAGGA